MDEKEALKKIKEAKSFGETCWAIDDIAKETKDKNLLIEVFNIAEKNDDKLTKSKNGNVILVRVIVISNFSESSVNPGAINATNSGIKISIINTITSKDKKRILKILFANNSALFLLLFNSEE